MLISNILNTSQLAQEVLNGYVTERFHNEFPNLAIYNYTPKCQYENAWNEVTLLCRGLITDTDTGEVLARPFPKFFNYGDEANAPKFDLDKQVVACEKFDGSLGIGYVRPDGRPAIATRGSFHSEQADWANRFLETNGGISFAIRESGRDTTVLVEIIYPENRIVVDYGALEKLVLLGGMKVDTGVFTANTATVIADLPLREVLSLPERAGKEGLVIWQGNEAVKLKYEDYVKLHRFISLLSPKTVWQALRDGSFDSFVSELPDEFHKEAKDMASNIRRDFNSIMNNAKSYWHPSVPTGDRKTQALWINANVPTFYRGLVFQLLDDKVIDDAVWRMVEPKGD